MINLLGIGAGSELIRYNISAKIIKAGISNADK